MRYTTCATCGIDFAKHILSRTDLLRRQQAFDAQDYGMFRERTICYLALLSE